MPPPLTLFCSGVPVRHHLYSDVRANTALAVEVDRSLMKWASSSIMRCHEICTFRKRRGKGGGRGTGLGCNMEGVGAVRARYRNVTANNTSPMRNTQGSIEQEPSRKALYKAATNTKKSEKPFRPNGPSIRFGNVRSVYVPVCVNPHAPEQPPPCPPSHSTKTEDAHSLPGTTGGEYINI